MVCLWRASVALVWGVAAGALPESEENLSAPLRVGDSQGHEGAADQEADELVTETARGLHRPVREGRVDVVARFLKALSQTPRVLPKILNWKDEVGATVLHWCAFYGSDAHVILAKSFLQIPGTDGSLLDKHNNSACHTACMRGHAGALEVLARPGRANGCDPFELNSEGMSCLHYAARQGDTQTLAILRPHLGAANVDVHSGGAHPTTPLYMAVTAGSAEAVRILLDAGASAAHGRRSGGTIDGEVGAVERARDLFSSYKAVLSAFGEQPTTRKPPASEWTEL